MRTNTRALALLLAFCMVVGFFPGVAYAAAEDPGPPEIGTDASVEGYELIDLTEGAASATTEFGGIASESKSIGQIFLGSEGLPELGFVQTYLAISGKNMLDTGAVSVKARLYAVDEDGNTGDSLAVSSNEVVLDGSDPDSYSFNSSLFFFDYDGLQPGQRYLLSFEPDDVYGSNGLLIASTQDGVVNNQGSDPVPMLGKDENGTWSPLSSSAWLRIYAQSAPVQNSSSNEYNNLNSDSLTIPSDDSLDSSLDNNSIPPVASFSLALPDTFAATTVDVSDIESPPNGHTLAKEDYNNYVATLTSLDTALKAITALSADQVDDANRLLTLAQEWTALWPSFQEKAFELGFSSYSTLSNLVISVESEITRVSNLKNKFDGEIFIADVNALSTALDGMTTHLSVEFGTIAIVKAYLYDIVKTDGTLSSLALRYEGLSAEGKNVQGALAAYVNIIKGGTVYSKAHELYDAIQPVEALLDDIDKAHNSYYTGIDFIGMSDEKFDKYVATITSLETRATGLSNFQKLLYNLETTTTDKLTEMLKWKPTATLTTLINAIKIFQETGITLDKATAYNTAPYSSALTTLWDNYAAASQSSIDGNPTIDDQLRVHKAKWDGFLAKAKALAFIKENQIPLLSASSTASATSIKKAWASYSSLYKQDKDNTTKSTTEAYNDKYVLLSALIAQLQTLKHVELDTNNSVVDSTVTYQATLVAHVNAINQSQLAAYVSSITSVENALNEAAKYWKKGSIGSLTASLNSLYSSLTSIDNDSKAMLGNLIKDNGTGLLNSQYTGSGDDFQLGSITSLFDQISQYREAIKIMTLYEQIAVHDDVVDITDSNISNLTEAYKNYKQLYESYTSTASKTSFVGIAEKVNAFVGMPNFIQTYWNYMMVLEFGKLVEKAKAGASITSILDGGYNGFTNEQRKINDAIGSISSLTSIGGSFTSLDWAYRSELVGYTAEAVILYQAFQKNEKWFDDENELKEAEDGDFLASVTSISSLTSIASYTSISTYSSLISLATLTSLGDTIEAYLAAALYVKNVEGVVGVVGADDVDTNGINWETLKSKIDIATQSSITSFASLSSVDQVYYNAKTAVLDNAVYLLEFPKVVGEFYGEYHDNSGNLIATPGSLSSFESDLDSVKASICSIGSTSSLTASFSSLIEAVKKLPGKDNFDLKDVVKKSKADPDAKDETQNSLTIAKVLELADEELVLLENQRDAQAYVASIISFMFDNRDDLSISVTQESAIQANHITYAKYASVTSWEGTYTSIKELVEIAQEKLTKTDGTDIDYLDDLLDTYYAFYKEAVERVTGFDLVADAIASVSSLYDYLYDDTGKLEELNIGSYADDTEKIDQYIAEAKEQVAKITTYDDDKTDKTSSSTDGYTAAGFYMDVYKNALPSTLASLVTDAEALVKAMEAIYKIMTNAGSVDLSDYESSEVESDLSYFVDLANKAIGSPGSLIKLIDALGTVTSLKDTTYLHQLINAGDQDDMYAMLYPIFASLTSLGKVSALTLGNYTDKKNVVDAVSSVWGSDDNTNGQLTTDMKKTINDNLIEVGYATALSLMKAFEKRFNELDALGSFNNEYQAITKSSDPAKNEQLDLLVKDVASLISDRNTHAEGLNNIRTALESKYNLLVDKDKAEVDVGYYKTYENLISEIDIKLKLIDGGGLTNLLEAWYTKYIQVKGTSASNRATLANDQYHYKDYYNNYYKIVSLLTNNGNDLKVEAKESWDALAVLLFRNDESLYDSVNQKPLQIVLDYLNAFEELRYFVEDQKGFWSNPASLSSLRGSSLDKFEALVKTMKNANTSLESNTVAYGLVQNYKNSDHPTEYNYYAYSNVSLYSDYIAQAKANVIIERLDEAVKPYLRSTASLTSMISKMTVSQILMEENDFTDITSAYNALSDSAVKTIIDTHAANNYANNKVGSLTSITYMTDLTDYIQELLASSAMYRDARLLQKAVNRLVTPTQLDNLATLASFATTGSLDQKNFDDAVTAIETAWNLHTNATTPKANGGKGYDEMLWSVHLDTLEIGNTDESILDRLTTLHNSIEPLKTAILYARLAASITSLGTVDDLEALAGSATSVTLLDENQGLGKKAAEIRAVYEEYSAVKEGFEVANQQKANDIEELYTKLQGIIKELLENDMYEDMLSSITSLGTVEDFKKLIENSTIGSLEDPSSALNASITSIENVYDKYTHIDFALYREGFDEKYATAVATLASLTGLVDTVEKTLWEQDTTKMTDDLVTALNQIGSIGSLKPTATSSGDDSAAAIGSVKTTLTSINSYINTYSVTDDIKATITSIYNNGYGYANVATALSFAYIEKRIDELEDMQQLLVATRKDVDALDNTIRTILAVVPSTLSSMTGGKYDYYNSDNVAKYGAIISLLSKFNSDYKNVIAKIPTKDNRVDAQTYGYIPDYSSITSLEEWLNTGLDEDLKVFNAEIDALWASVSSIDFTELTNDLVVRIDRAKASYTSLYTRVDANRTKHLIEMVDKAEKYKQWQADTGLSDDAVAKLVNGYIQALIDSTNNGANLKITDTATIASIKAAREMYDKLTAGQKALVNATLTSLEDKVIQLVKEKTEKDKTAAGNVDTLIIAAYNATPTGTNNFTLQDVAKIEAIDAAIKAYGKLTDDQQKLVTNFNSTLTSMVEKLGTLRGSAVADKAAADIVTASITAIYKASTTSLTDAKAARQAYNELTATQKAYVTEEAYKQLVEMEVELAAEESTNATNNAKADLVFAALNAAQSSFTSIGADNLKNDKDIIAKINAAIALYESVDSAVKNIVDGKLTDKSIITTMSNAVAAVAEAPKAVNGSLTSIQTDVKDLNGVENITLLNTELIAKVEATRAAYNALTAAQKAMVDSTLYAVLVEVEAQIAKLKGSDVQDQIDAALADQIKTQLDAVYSSLISLTGGISLANAVLIAQMESIVALVNAQTGSVSSILNADAGVQDQLSAINTALSKVSKMKSSISSLENDITSLGDSKVLAEIEAVVNKYNALDDSLKPYVSSVLYGKLMKLYAEAKAEAADAEKLQKDKEAVEAVEAVVNALPAVDALTLNDELAVINARASLSSLSADQKTTYTASVSSMNNTIAALEQKIIDLRVAEAKQQAIIDEATKQIDAIYNTYKNVASPSSLSAGDIVTIKRAIDLYNANVASLSSLSTKIAALIELLTNCDAEKLALDLAAVEAVNDAIANIPTDIDVVDGTLVAVALARTLVDNLRTDLIGSVTSISTLTDAESAIQSLIKEAKTLSASITSLNTTSPNATLVEEARRAYNDLTDGQKALISGEVYKVLLKAEKAVKDAENVKAAQNVIGLINTASTNSLTTLDKAAIRTAETAYNNLSDTVKAFVTNYADLVVLLAKLAAQEAAEAAEAAAVQKVKDAIDAIDHITKIDITANVLAVVANARALYEALATKTSIDAATLNKLTTAENTIATMKTDAEKVASDINTLYAKVNSIDAAFIASYTSLNGTYTSLSDGQKAYIGAAVEAQLTTMANAIAAYYDAQNLVSTITSLALLLVDSVPLSSDSKAAIRAAQEAYNNLSVSARAYVTNYMDLVSLMAKLSAQEADEAAEAAEAAAQTEAALVIELIKQASASSLSNDYYEMSKALYDAALAAYNKLSANGRVKEIVDAAFVTNVLDVIDGRVTVKKQEFDAARQEAKDIEKEIKRLFEKTTVLTDEAAIKAVRESYSSMARPDLLGAEYLQNLVKVEQRLAELKNAGTADQEAADKVIALITAIGTATSIEDILALESKIIVARAAFNALTGVQQGLVANSTVLTAAEAALAQAKLDAVANVESMLGGYTKDSKPTKATISSFENDVKAARAAYDALSGALKASVSSVWLEKLVELEAAVAKYYQDIAAEDATNAAMVAFVTSLVNNANSLYANDTDLNNANTISAINTAKAAYALLNEAQLALFAATNAYTAYTTMTNALAAKEQTESANKQEADAIIASITSLANITALDEAIVKQINDLMDAYENSSDAVKNYIGSVDYANLVTLVNKAKAWTDDQADQAEAAKVVTLINNATITNRQTIANARAEYNKLSPKQKGYVTNLSVLEQKEADLAAVKAVENLLEVAKAELAKDGATLSNAATMGKVMVAIEAYEAFANKAAVTNSAIYSELTKAVSDYNSSQAPDLQAAGAVIASITALYNKYSNETIETLTAEIYNEIKAVWGSYTSLTGDQKALVNSLYYAELEQMNNLAKAWKALKTDEAAAAAVDATISSITSLDEAKIKEAREAYNALTPAQKALVTKLIDLQEWEAKLADQKADQAAADVVKALINSLATVTSLSDEDKVKAVRAAYDGLTPAQKNLVDETALITAETKITGYKTTEATTVESELKSFNKNTVLTTNNIEEVRAAVIAARTAYDALRADIKALVKPSWVTDLTTLESAIVAFDKQAAIDAAAAQAVEALIAKASASSLSWELYNAANDAYGKLTDAQKLLVKNSGDLAIIKAALEAADKAEQDKIDAAKAVETAINGLYSQIASVDFKDLTSTQVTAINNALASLSNLGDLIEYIPAETIVKAEAMKNKRDANAAYLIDLGEAQIVINMIASITSLNEAEITAARLAYENLTGAQKGYVTNYADLQTQEDALAKHIADQAEAAAKIAFVEQLLREANTAFNDSGKAITESNISKINAAIEAYNALGTTLQSQVKATETAYYNTLKKAIADKAATEGEDKLAAATVTSLIAALQAKYGSATITGLDADKVAEILAVLASYTSLTPAQKPYVDSISYANLMNMVNTANAWLANEADKKAAGLVDEAILAIQAVDETKIKAAREAYDLLTPAQKALVTKLIGLQEWEAKLADQKADQAAAKVVSDMITAVGTLALDDYDAIKAIEKAYDKLSATQKAMVVGYNIVSNYYTNIMTPAINNATAKLTGYDISTVINKDTVAGAKAAVTNWKTAYANLPVGVRGEIDQSYLAIVEYLETEIAKYEKQAAEEEAANKAKIALVEGLIDAAEALYNNDKSLNDVNTVSAIEAAVGAYKALVEANLDVESDKAAILSVMKLALEDKLSKENENQTAANSVRDLINAAYKDLATATVGSLKGEDVTRIEALRASYSSLTSVQQGYLANEVYAKLLEMENLAAAKAEYDVDMAKAQEVIALIASITSLDKTQIETARAAYETLTSIQKGYVTNLAHLQTQEAALAAKEAKDEADQKAADMVIALIESSFNDTYNKELYKAAEAAYDALSDDQKELVNSSEFNKVKLDAIKRAQDEKDVQDAIDIAAVETVETAIAELYKDLNNLTLKDHEKAVSDLRLAYNGLNRQDLVAPMSIDQLVQLEQKIASLIAQVEIDKAAAAVINDMVSAIKLDEFTIQDYHKLSAINGAYEALTVEQKAYVNETAYQALKTQYNSLKTQYVNSFVGALQNYNIDIVVTKGNYDLAKNAATSARGYYNGATDDVRAEIEKQIKVSNGQKYVDILLALEKSIIIYEYNVAQAAKADAEIKTLITGLGSNPNYSDTAVRAVINNAAAIYDELLDVQQEMVTAEAKKLLNDALKAIEGPDTAAADAVIAMISELDLVTPNKADVEAARAAYDALSSNEKTLVTNYNDLVQAETILLLDGSATDANGVIALIKTLLEMKIDQTNYAIARALMNKIDAAYTALSAVNKRKVTNYTSYTANKNAINILIKTYEKGAI